MLISASTPVAVLVVSICPLVPKHLDKGVNTGSSQLVLPRTSHFTVLANHCSRVYPGATIVS